MRVLIILNSEKPEFAFLHIVKYLILSGNEIDIYDVATTINEELKGFINHEICLSSSLEEAIIEYYQMAMCSYNTLSFAKNLNIYIFSYYLNSTGKDFLNNGADFLFVSKGKCICDSSFMEIGAPCIEECTGYAEISENSNTFYETFYNSISSINKNMLMDMNYPLFCEYHYDNLIKEIEQCSTIPFKQIKSKRIEHFIRTTNRVDCLSADFDIRLYLAALNEVIENRNFNIDEILNYEKVLLYFFIKQNLHISKPKTHLDIIYQTYLRNNLCESLEQLADKNVTSTNSYYFVKCICAYRNEKYETCIYYYEKYSNNFYKSENDVSVFENDDYKELAATYYYMSKIKCNLCGSNLNEFAFFLKSLTQKKKSNFFKEILKKSTEFLRQGNYADCTQACMLYDRLYQIVGEDIHYYKNRYWYYKNLGAVDHSNKHKIAGFHKRLLSLIFFVANYCNNVKNKIGNLKAKNKVLKIIFRGKKFLKRKIKALFSILHIYGKNERKLLKYQNKFYGKRCFIIGNGPSLKVSDLEKMKKNNDYCFACNKIYKIFDKTSWRPDFYACTDSAVFRQNYYSILKRIQCPKFFGINLPMQDKIKADTCNISINYATKPIEKTKFNPKATFIYSGGTVTYVLITLAWLMGFREIYLVGCDHSYGFFTNQTGQSMTSTVETNKDYFMKNYMRPGEKINVGNLNRSKSGYLIAKNYIESHGGKIFNATRGGKLEVFTRANLDDILSKERKTEYENSSICSN